MEVNKWRKFSVKFYEIQDLKEGQGRIETKVDNHGIRFDQLETKVDKIEADVSILKTDLAVLDKKADNLDKKIDNQNIFIIQGLEPYFATLEKSIEKHQESIDILSARSFQHEVDFKSIKRLLISP